MGTHRFLSSVLLQKTQKETKENSAGSASKQTFEAVAMVLGLPGGGGRCLVHQRNIDVA